MVAILRTLAAIAYKCERSTKQMLEDPANFFVVDLATSASESTGIPVAVQITACFFLACCFLALDDSTEGKSVSNSESADILQKRSFLTMIDSRIGLNRFTEFLKKPW